MTANEELTIDEWDVVWNAVYAGDDDAKAKAILRDRPNAVRGFIQDTSDEPETDWRFICGMLGIEVPDEA
jgi:hypothetical protein